MKWYQAYVFVSLTLGLITTSKVTLANSANKQFMNCCNQKYNINEWCKKKLCTFSITAEQALMTFPVCTKFSNTLTNIWQCANANHDHSKCCKKKRVPRNCLSYCNGTPISNIADFNCFYYFRRILTCFKKYYEKQ